MSAEPTVKPQTEETKAAGEEQPTQDVRQRVIEEIKKHTNPLQIKLIGLFKLLDEVKAADAVYEQAYSKNSYNLHLKAKALFGEALKIYKAETAFTKSAVKDLSLFFTPEEIADPNFEKSEAVPAENPWLTLLTKIEMINAYITDEDEKVLKHLKHIDIALHPDNDNFEVEFLFEPNEYFTNDKLKLEVIVDDSEEDGQPIIEVKSTEIAWNKGKDVRNEEKTTKAKTKKGKKIPAKVKVERVESFFWLFKEHVKEDEEEPEEEEEDDEEANDPLSDRGLYAQASDILETMRKNLYIYAIPAMFGVKVEEFAGMGDFDAEEVQKQLGEGGQKPECKQQ